MADDEHKTLQSFAEFLAVVAQQHRGTLNSNASAGAAGSKLKNGFLKFVPWISKEQRSNGGDMLRQGSKGTNGGVAKKQAWSDSSPVRPTASDDVSCDLGMAHDKPIANPVAKTNKVAIDGCDPEIRVQLDTPADESAMTRKSESAVVHAGRESVKHRRIVRLDSPADDSAMTRESESAVVHVGRESVKHHRIVRLDSPADDCVMNRSSTALRAKQTCEVKNKSMVWMAQEVREQADRQQGPMAELETQWLESEFAHMDHEHQQQLRRAIGLPPLP